MCEFKGSSRAPGGWNNGVNHSNDVLQARANVKNIKYEEVYGIARLESDVVFNEVVQRLQESKIRMLQEV